MQTSSPEDDPLSRWNPFTFFKALIYEEYYADMSPSDDPLFRWNPFTFFRALLYEEYYADMSP